MTWQHYMCGQKSGVLKRPFTGLAAAGPWGYSNAKWHPDQRHWCTAGNCRWVDQPGTAESFAALSFRRVLTKRYTPDRCHFSGKNHWYINHQIGGYIPYFHTAIFPGKYDGEVPKASQSMDVLTFEPYPHDWLCKSSMCVSPQGSLNSVGQNWFMKAPYWEGYSWWSP